MAIKEFDRPTARVVSEQAQRALEETARLYGLTVTYRGGRFTADTFTAKFEFAVQNPDGTAKTSDVEAFERYAPRNGLGDQFGKQFVSDGRVYEIAGWAPRRPKRPVICKRVADGKRFVFAVPTVKFALGKFLDGKSEVTL